MEIRPNLKAVVLHLLHPLREPVTWSCQHGFLPSSVRRFLPWRWGLEPFTIYGPGGKSRWVPTEFDSVGHEVFWSGLRKWEKETSPVILQQIAKAKCFIDIGANSGMYTVLGSTLNPDVRTIAVEPVPKVFAALQRNIAQNDLTARVTAVNLALGDSNGVVPFHESEDATMGSLSVSGYHQLPGKVIHVECKTLDSLVEELGIQPDFLKIDVEGFEHAVLAGARQVLARFQPGIVLEANPGDDAASVTEILAQHGYTFYCITDKGPDQRGAIIPVDAFRYWLCLR